MSTNNIDSIRESKAPKPLDDYQLLTVEEFASLLRIEPRTVWRRLSKKEIPEPVRFGGNTRWKYSKIRDWIDHGCPAQNKSKH